MNKFTDLLLKGFFAVFPVVLTASVIIWLFNEAEALLKPLITRVVPEDMYVTGMSIPLVAVLLVVIGGLVNAYLFRRFDQLIERFMKAIPFVRTLYASIKDISEFILGANERKNLGSVVLVLLDKDIKLIGFVMKEQTTINNHEGMAAIYIPMSFQIGGYTLFLPESKYEYMDMDSQEAMRMVLTGALNNNGANKAV